MPTILNFLQELNEHHIEMDMQEEYSRPLTLVIDRNESMASSSETVSKDDPDRKELLWEPREEKIVYGWREDCLKAAKAHGIKARILKKRYTAVALPAILIPLIMSGFSSLLIPHPIVNSSLLVITSICTGLSAFLNLGKLTQSHFQYAGSYADMARHIEREMCKPKRHRIACDVYLERVGSRLSALDLSAPSL